MRPEFSAFLLSLSDSDEIARAREVLHAFELWQARCETTVEASLIAKFGRDRTGYVTVSDLSGLGERKSIRAALCKLGFREALMYVDGVKTRLWLRGPSGIGSREVARLPRLGRPVALAPCPVP